MTALEDLKIQEERFNELKIAALPDRPSESGMSAEDLKKRFDAAAREILLPAFNALIDYLIAEGASGIGVADGENNIDLQTLLNTVVRFATTDVKYIRINADNQLETSADGKVWEATGSSGHLIVDANGRELPQRSRMKFSNAIAEDVDGVTVVYGIKGEQGDQGLQGFKGDTGEKGEKGEKGDTGPVLVPIISDDGMISWEIRNDGSVPASRFIRGPQGTQGVQGPQGPQGPQGVQGATGKQGPQGPQGEAGANGKDGRSLYIEDTYASLAALKNAIPVGNSNMYFVEDLAECFIWSETNKDWISVGRLQGPQGPQGIQGVQGETGPQGEQGPQGPQGVQGQQGVQGIQGPEGPAGPQGPKGDTGDTGPAGPQGVQGPAGPQGPKGDAGEVDYSRLDGYVQKTSTENWTFTLENGNTVTKKVCIV